MAVVRLNLDLAIPQTTYDAIPVAKKIAFRDMVRGLKALSVNINAGQPNEEMTTRAVYRICHHDEGLNHPPCGEEQEI